MVVGMVVILYLAGLGGWQTWRQLRNEETDWLRWRRAAKLAICASLIPAVFWLYNLIFFQIDPFLKTWTMQSGLASPHLLHYLLAYAVFLPFAFLGGLVLLRSDPWRGWLPTIWALSLPLLAYVPFGMQRRLPEGVWVAIVILSVAFMERRNYRWLHAPAFAAGFLFLSLLSTLLLFAGGIQVAVRPGQPLFRPTGEIGMFEKISTIASRDDAILASYETGHALPAWTPQFAVIGHGPESVYFNSIDRAVQAFYQNETSDEVRRSLLQSFAVDYVVWGPAERKLGEWSPARAGYLAQLWSEGGYALYEVIR